MDAAAADAAAAAKATSLPACVPSCHLPTVAAALGMEEAHATVSTSVAMTPPYVNIEPYS